MLDEKTVVACDNQECTDWLGSFYEGCGFWGRAQEAVIRAFGLGIGAFAVWMDTEAVLWRFGIMTRGGSFLSVGIARGQRVRVRHTVVRGR